LCASAHQEGVFNCARLSPKNAPFTPSTLVRVAGLRTISEKELVSSQYLFGTCFGIGRQKPVVPVDYFPSTLQSYKDQTLANTVNTDRIDRRIVAHDSSGTQLSKLTVIVHY
jgi:hypothetical protein